MVKLGQGSKQAWYVGMAQVVFSKFIFTFMQQQQLVHGLCRAK